MSEQVIPGCFKYSDYEANGFKISVDIRKSDSKTSSLGMKKADFALLRELVSKVPWKIILKVMASISTSHFKHLQRTQK